MGGRSPGFSAPEHVSWVQGRKDRGEGGPGGPGRLADRATSRPSRAQAPSTGRRCPGACVLSPAPRQAPPLALALGPPRPAPAPALPLAEGLASSGALQRTSRSRGRLFTHAPPLSVLCSRHH